mmetsp:Transcript_14945/g.41984  ORF Transcript_14945/g.41984 Transcript_14945/m.41984 type:complete len:235 (-) Transcript_14945:166-870(-)
MLLPHLRRAALLSLQTARTFASAASSAPQKKATWWEDESLDCSGLYKTLIYKLDKEGPQKPSTLLALFERCETPEDATRAVKACRRLRGQRGRRGINHSIDPSVTTGLVKAATRVGNPDVALDALRRAHELQLTPVPGSYRHLMIHYAAAKQPAKMLDTFEAMKAAGLRPKGDVAFALIRGFVDNGLPDAAKLVVKEFEGNGVEVPQVAFRLLEKKAAGILPAAAVEPAADDGT